MGEYVNLHLGSAGCRFGSEYWKLLDLEYASAGSEVSRHCDYSEGLFGGYNPRAVLAGADPRVMSDIDGYYNLDNFKMDCLLPRNDFYQSNDDEVMEAVRCQLEDCDYFQGFNIHHSVFSSSTGQLTVKILERMNDMFPKSIIQTFSLYPSAVSDCGDFDLYNAMFVTAALSDKATITNCFDNKALIKGCVETGKVKNPTLRDMNQALAQYISGVTCGYRFGGELNSSLRKVATNLICFPRLHFMLPSMTHWGAAQTSYSTETIRMKVTACLVGSGCSLVSVDTKHGRFVSSQLFFRGSALKTHEVESEMGQSQYRNSSYFVEWVPNTISGTICRNSPLTSDGKSGCVESSVSAMSMSTAAYEMFEILQGKITAMFRRKSGCYMLDQAGYSETEVKEKIATLKEIIAEHQLYQNYAPEEDYGREGY